MSVGILLLQYIFAVGILAFLSQQNYNTVASVIGKSVLYSAMLIILATLLNNMIFTRVVKHLSKDAEILFLASLSTLFIMTYLTYRLGLPLAIGAFLAGIAIAVIPYSTEIISRASSLRDFFVMLFFISLGTKLNLKDVVGSLDLVVGLLLMTLLVKPATIYTLLSMRGYERRVAFLPAAYLAQMSEFTLVLVGIASTAGILESRVAGAMIFSTLVTMCLTPYAINHAGRLFNIFERYLVLYDRAFRMKRMIHESEEEVKREKLSNHIIICGGKFTGRLIAEKLMTRNLPFIIVDFDPEIVERFMKENVPAIYGDLMHPEVLESANVKKAKLIISTISDREANTFLSVTTKRVNPRVGVVCFAEDVEEALYYYETGVDLVLVPKLITVDRVASTIIRLGEERVKDMRAELKRMREAQLELLRNERMKELAPHAEYLESIRKKVVG